MAKSVGSFNWERGFREPSDSKPWELDNGDDDVDNLRLPPRRKSSPARHTISWALTFYEHGLRCTMKPVRPMDYPAGGNHNVT
jgi:hypothetical protein